VARAGGGPSRPLPRREPPRRSLDAVEEIDLRVVIVDENKT